MVVASLHVPANNEAENTKRLIRTAENKFVHIIGHMTGRLLLEREPYPVNVQAVIDACAETGTWIELNCNPPPVRFGLAALGLCQEQRCEMCYYPDSHRNEHAGFLQLGAGMARKGWLEKKDIINTFPLEKLWNKAGQKRINRSIMFFKNVL